MEFKESLTQFYTKMSFKISNRHSTLVFQNKILEDFGQFWTILDNFGQFWTILDNFG
jgi:hypothetical protein